MYNRRFTAHNQNTYQLTIECLHQSLRRDSDALTVGILIPMALEREPADDAQWHFENVLAAANASSKGIVAHRAMEFGLRSYAEDSEVSVGQLTA